MKKNILLIFVFGLIAASCKKTYTCSCTTVWTYPTSSGGSDTRFFPADKTPYEKKLSKKQAEASCEHQRLTIQSSFTSLYTSDGKYPLYTGESIKTDCILNN